jgi:tRNA pseudouridine38-40 synthase
MRVALKFAYDGRNFNGYARQPQLRTVEGELIKGLIKHGIIEDTNESCFRSASRTDKGVSALCNVVAFNTNSSKSNILEKLSDEFTDIIVYAIKDVNSDFNPRYAKYRQYQYSLKITGHDADKIITAASCFTGQHDFTNFARVEEFKDPVRTIDNIIFTPKNNFLIIDFYAQTFLWNQIRRIISSLDKVGLGKLQKDQIVEALNNPDKDFDFSVSPAESLILKDIVYDFDFEIFKKGKTKLTNLENKLISL